jgi:hypothetical protein
MAFFLHCYGCETNYLRNFSHILASGSSNTAEYRKQMETNDKGGRGKEQEAGGSEASGRGRQSAQTCFNCGALNYVDSDWTWFTCWKCNLQKPMPLPGH